MATAIDPVCKMEVDTTNPPGGQSEYGGTTYYFCAPGCKHTFDQQPERYLGGETQPRAPEKKPSLLGRIFGRK